jgi:hypothetical protein
VTSVPAPKRDALPQWLKATQDLLKAFLRLHRCFRAVDSGDINPALNTVHTLVAVKPAEGWRTAHFQSTPAAWHGRQRDSAALTDELRDVMNSGLICQ